MNAATPLGAWGRSVNFLAPADANDTTPGTAETEIAETFTSTGNWLAT